MYDALIADIDRALSERSVRQRCVSYCHTASGHTQWSLSMWMHGSECLEADPFYGRNNTKATQNYIHENNYKTLICMLGGVCKLPMSAPTFRWCAVTRSLAEYYYLLAYRSYNSVLIVLQPRDSNKSDCDSTMAVLQKLCQSLSNKYYIKWRNSSDEILKYNKISKKILQFLHLHFLISVSSLISSWHALQ